MQYGKVTQASTLETGGDYFNSQLCDLLAMGLYTKGKNDQKTSSK